MSISERTQTSLMSEQLTNRIRVLRAEHKLSQSELANAIGVSRKTISTIEVGRFVPSTIIAMQLARHFGVSVEEIFTLAESTSKKTS
jgi:putative transcriptional regulator